MRKNDFVQLAIVGLVASFCISGQAAREDRREVAMSKCTRDTSDTPNQGSNCDGNGSCPAPGADAQSQSDKLAPSPEAGRKSAARKVVEGNHPSNTSFHVRKGAAKKAMEAELRYQL